MEVKKQPQKGTIISDKFIFAKSITEDFVNHINSCHEDEVLWISNPQLLQQRIICLCDESACCVQSKTYLIAKFKLVVCHISISCFNLCLLVSALLSS